MFDMFDDSNSYSESIPNSVSSSSSVGGGARKGFVLSVGGSVFFGEDVLVDKILALNSLIGELRDRFDFVLVVGGGQTARKFIGVGRDLGLNFFEQDSIGLLGTRLNASVFALSVPSGEGFVRTSISGVESAIKLGFVPVFGGLQEGQTTDAVGALLAEKLGFVFVNLSNVSGVFDADPNKFKDAVLFEELSFDDMLFLLRSASNHPGQNIFVDVFAASILVRSKIVSFFVSGNDLGNLRNCLLGESFVGTRVSDVSAVIKDKGLVSKKIVRKGIRKKSASKSRYSKKSVLNNESSFVDSDFDESSFVDNGSRNSGSDDSMIDPSEIDFR